ncbi:MAG: hypothetical protein AB9882_12030 [Ignavibacteriaceae bacterium]
MFESEINTIIESNLRRIDELGPYITLPSLASAGLHPALVTYLSAEIDFLVYSDRKKLLSRSLFDYSGDVIDSLFAKISAEIKTKSVLSHEETEKLIEQGVLFNLYFLLRPRWTLLKFIFNEESVKPIEVLKLSLNYIHFYPYIKDILLNFFDKKNMTEISREEFKGLLLSIQEYIMQQNKTELIKRELACISSYLNSEKDNTIPLPAVEIYLKEKEETALLAKLGAVFPDDFNGRVDLAMINEILSAPAEPPPKKKPVIEKASHAEEDTTQPASENIENQEQILTGLLLEPEEEIQKEYLFGEDTLFGILNNNGTNLTPETPSEIQPENEVSEEIKPVEENIPDNPKIEKVVVVQEIIAEDKQEFTPALQNSGLEEEPGKDYNELGDQLNEVFTDPSAEERISLLELFTDKECDRIIADCFNEDQMDFINTIEKIGECNSYEEATESLNSAPFFSSLNHDDKNLVLIREKLEIYFNK